MTIGILAFGSLIDDRGPEIEALVRDAIPVETPFPVEFARYSAKRGDSATLVPFAAGLRVNAKILVLDGSVTEADATDMLWRREVGEVDSTLRYPAKTTRNAVRILRCDGLGGIDIVLYVDFFDAGKIPTPAAAELADRAVKSATKAKPGHDGISYLKAALDNGITTPLSAAYEKEILQQTSSADLAEAIVKARAIKRA